MLGVVLSSKSGLLSAPDYLSGSIRHLPSALKTQTKPYQRRSTHTVNMRAGLLLCLALTVPAVWSFSCSGVPDGVYEESCKTFVKCEGGIATTVECQGNTVSNGGDLDNITCVSEDMVDPPCGLKRDCTLLGDGRYADVATNCTSYFTCHNGYYYGHNFCTGGLEFDENLGLCNWPNPNQPCHSKAPVEIVG